jgi:phage terminase small subunit
MSGAKGKSGGVRKGAGRKPSAKPAAETKPIPMGDRDMLEVLQDVALGKIEATALQVRAAIAAVQYTHIKKHDGGIKDGKNDKAKKAIGGKFTHSAPPRLVVNNK